ncbi:MAG: 7-carboxy-7-deazaguanine synthase QueE [Armatimonadota bacterium]
MNNITPSSLDETDGSLAEIFSGIQGEGLFVGTRQIFVRLNGCNLDCSYCDTKSSRNSTDSCRIEQRPGQRDFIEIPNPIEYAEAADYICRLDNPSGLHLCVSMTGGEPLFQTGYAVNLARELKSRGLSVMLETNGTLPDALCSILPYIDIISMDIKLPSAFGGEDILSIHQRFLEEAKFADVYVKTVVSSKTTIDEIRNAAKMIADINPDIPMIIQPVTPNSGVLPPSPSDVLNWQAECSLYLLDIRVIPQCHKFIGQL